MEGKIRIVVRGEPAAWGRPGMTVIGGHARAFTPKKTRTREGIVATAAIDAMAGRPPLAVPVVMSVLFVMSVPQSWSEKKKRAALAGEIVPAKKPDLSNCLKLVEDALNTIVFYDDALIVEGRQRKEYGAVPQTIIEVMPDEGRAA